MITRTYCKYQKNTDNDNSDDDNGDIHTYKL